MAPAGSAYISHHPAHPSLAQTGINPAQMQPAFMPAPSVANAVPIQAIQADYAMNYPPATFPVPAVGSFQPQPVQSAGHGHMPHAQIQPQSHYFPHYQAAPFTPYAAPINPYAAAAVPAIVQSPSAQGVPILAQHPVSAAPKTRSELETTSTQSGN